MNKNKIVISAMLLITTLTMCSNSTQNARFFKGKRITHNIKLIFNKPAEQVFPLLCPVREYEWMASWKGTTVYTDSGYAEQYVVFYHSIPFPLMFKKAYWTASQYIPDSRIQWVVTVPGICIIIIDEDIKDIGNGKSEIKYSYTITGLSRTGNTLISKMFTREKLLQEMNRTREEIEFYLEHGRMLDTEYSSEMFN